MQRLFQTAAIYIKGITRKQAALEGSRSSEQNYLRFNNLIGP